MPRLRYRNQIVRIGQYLSPSGRALRDALTARGYNGRPINWGHYKYDGLNTPDAILLSSNKRRALYTMRDANMPVPALYGLTESLVLASESSPLIARKSYHSKGSGFWFCESADDVRVAQRQGATHYMEYFGGAREFRVHVVNGDSIKISEKHKSYDPETGEFIEGSWTYPSAFRRKVTMRRIAKEAVGALGLDFGAVDILYKKIDDQPTFRVLEVNTAPNLTESINGDTLNRYVEAFMEDKNEQ